MNWLDYNPRLDRYYDPPEPPTRGKCNRCGDVMDYGDMDEIDGEYYCPECAALVRMEATIERLQSERRWIPVSERLPEMNVHVFTLDYHNKAVIESRSTYWDDGNYNFKTYKVNYWMPLPPPPEADDEN